MSTKVTPGQSCVYAHSVNGEVFYIGEGGSTRPYNTASRNEIWRRIVADAGEFEVTVLGWFSSKHAARIAEAQQISEHLPAANVPPRPPRPTRGALPSKFGVRVSDLAKELGVTRQAVDDAIRRTQVKPRLNVVGWRELSASQVSIVRQAMRAGGKANGKGKR